MSRVKPGRKTTAALLTAGLFFGANAYPGDSLVPAEKSYRSTPVSAEVQAGLTRVKEAVAGLARIAIAERFAGCDITSVASHGAKIQQDTFNVPADKPRNRVDVGVHLTEDAKANAFMSQYATSPDVHWSTAQFMARKPVLGKQGVDALGMSIPAEERLEHTASEQSLDMTESVYPYGDSQEGQRINLYVTSIASSHEGPLTGGQDKSAFATRFCGTLVLKQTAKGLVWQQDPAAQPVGEILRQQTCDIVPDQGNPDVMHPENCVITTTTLPVHLEQ